MKRIDIVTKAWGDYELLDTGNNRKLERFGTMILDRPDPQAIWSKSTPDLWNNAQAQFSWTDKKEKWSITKGAPESWELSYTEMKLHIALGNFKHIGIFPEHAAQWEEVASLVHKNQGLTMLNLFGYTGAASIVAAQAGAKVTHIDASKQTISTVKENMMLSQLPADSIRLVCEDALKYAKRLVTRGETFDIIVMDPPAFGRGPKGEVWKIEESLAELVSLLPKLVAPHAKLVILNGYAAGYSARTFGEILAEALPHGSISYGDVGIAQNNSGRILSTGIYAKWQA